MADQILEVDLLQFETGDAASRRAVVDGVMRSLATGFVYVAHDLSDDLIDTAYGMLETFFSLPIDTKLGSVAPGSFGQTGYTGLLVETAAIAEVPDWKEMLNWGRSLPEGHPLRAKYPKRYRERVLPEADVPGITAVLDELHERVLDVQRRFLRIVAVGLGAHETFFDRMLQDGTTLTRALHYPPMSAVPGGVAGHVWSGEHTDINLVTALPRATAPGLQVKTAEGWIDAVAPPGRAILNTGIMLEHVSNGIVEAGWHRVVAADDHDGDRYSVVQFCHPTPWTILAPLHSCVTAEHPQRYAPIEAGNRLDQVLYEINLVEDARRV